MNKDKLLVKEFIEFLKNHKGYINTNSNTIDYRTLARALENTIAAALEDGYQKGFRECDAANYFEVKAKERFDFE